LENNDKYDITFKSATINMKYEYTLLTNLDNKKYDDKIIKKLYAERWSIAIFFKLLKYNFKFEHLIEHNKKQNYDQYKKLYLVNLSIIYLSKIFDKTYYYNNKVKKDYIKKEKNKNIKYVNRPNKSNIIKGVYKILDILLKSKLKKNILENVCLCYVKYKFIKLGDHKERKSKTPF